MSSNHLAPIVSYFDGHALANSRLERFQFSTSEQCQRSFSMWLDGHPRLLRSQLPHSTHAEIPGSTDPRVSVLTAWQYLGSNFADALDGPYAVILWDANKKRLLAARDSLGQRPLRWAEGERQTVHIAQRDQELLSQPGVSGELDESHVVDYLLRRFNHPTRTFYQGVHQVPAGHTLVFRKRGMNVIAHSEAKVVLPWEETGRLLEPSSWAEELWEKLGDAVEEEVTSCSGRVGILLSGGLDSSLVSAVLADRQRFHHNEDIYAVSATWNSVPRSNEHSYSHAVASHLGLLHDCVVLDAVSPLSQIESVLDEQQEPFFNPQMYLHRTLYRHAQRQGVAKLLTGEGGDTILGDGLQTLHFLAKRWQILAAWQYARIVGEHYSSDTWRVFRAHFISEIIPSWLKRLQRPLRPLPVPAMGILHHHVGRKAMHRHKKSLDHLGHRSFESHLKPWRNLTDPLQAWIGEVDYRTAQAQKIEIGHPLFDARVIALCLALPPRLHLRDGKPRWIARAAARERLPPIIHQRVGKSDLWPAFAHGLLTLDSSRIQHELLVDTTALAPWVHHERLRQVVEHFLSTGDQHSGLLTWQALTLSLWLRQRGHI